MLPGMSVSATFCPPSKVSTGSELWMHLTSASADMGTSEAVSASINQKHLLTLKPEAEFFEGEQEETSLAQLTSSLETLMICLM